jgi:hypothetical protein
VGPLFFLILLIIATGVLIAWVLLELARLALSDLRLQSASSGPSPITRVAETVSAAVTRDRAAGQARNGATKPAGPAADGRARHDDAETVLYDEVETEQAVREMLYGGRGRRV